MKAPTEALEGLLVHDAWVNRLARSLVRDPNQADDLVQETWLAALRRPPGDQAPRAWLARVVRNFALQRSRSELRRTRREQEEPRRYASLSPDEDAERSDTQRTLAAAVLDLDEPYRSTVVQSYYGGRTSIEISRQMGVPAGTVRWRLKRGIEQLREQLDSRFEGKREEWRAVLIAWIARREPSPPPPVAPAMGRLALVGSIAALALVPWSSTPPELSPLELVEAGSVASPGGMVSLPARVETSPRIDAATVPTAEPPATPRTRTIEVQVVDIAGKPIPGATVFSLANAEEGTQLNGTRRDARGVSDANGKLVVEVRAEDLGVPVGYPLLGSRLSLSASAPLRPHSETYNLLPDEHGARLSILLLSKAIAWSGRVVNAEGVPVAGANIALHDSDMRPRPRLDGVVKTRPPLVTSSDDDGRFVLADAPPRSGELLVSAAGYAVLQRDVDPVTHPHAGLEFQLEREAIVEGIVRRADGTPVVGGRVWINPERPRGPIPMTTTDGEGRFHLEGLVSGRQRIVAQDSREDRIASQTFELLPGVVRDWSPTLSPAVGIHLRLVDGSGEPLAHRSARLVALDSELLWQDLEVTDDQGRIHAWTAPEGTYEVLVYDEPSEAMWSLPVATRTNLATGFEEHLIVIQEVGDRDGLLRGRLHGRLRLFADARVLVTDVHSQNSLDFTLRRGGAYRISSLAAGRYELLALLGSYGALALGNFDLADGQNVEIEDGYLPDLGSFEVRWADGTDTAERDARWRLEQRVERERGSVWWPIDSGEGALPSPREVLAGHWRLRVESEGRRWERVFQLEEFEDTLIEVPVRATSSRR